VTEDANEHSEKADDAPHFEWSIVEIYGHRRHAGRVLEEERFGAKFLRIDIPQFAFPEADGDEAPQPVLTGWTSHSYGGAAIFSMTPTDEATVMRMNRPYGRRPRYSLPAPSEDQERDDF